MIKITHNDSELTIQGDTIAKRVKENRLRRVLQVAMLEDDDLRETALYAVIYLSHVKDGDIGLTLPSEGDSLDVVVTFLEAFGQLDSSLLEAIDEGVKQTRHITNDVELLPPDELDEDTLKKKQSAKSA